MPTTNLGLPLLAADQAQKHVTVNEGLLAIDGIVQCAIKELNRNAPPTTAADGDRYIIGSAPTGAWTGKAYKLAIALDSAWRFHEPRPGWRVYNLADDTLYVLDSGSVWRKVVGLPDNGAVIQNAALLGLNTTADAANPLSARINKALFTALYAADGGDGSLLYTMNKETAADDVGLLLQTNYVLHAMLGLMGGDDFYFKVSPDGATFFDAIRILKDSGIVQMSRLPRFAANVNYDAYVPAAAWTTVPLNNATYNDQGMFDGGANKAVAPIAGTYMVGASLAWHQNGTNLPTDMRARLLKGASTVVHGPVQTKTLTEGVITLEFATMLTLAAADEISLQTWFSGADGYAAQNATGMWGYLIG
ncbi:MAG: DUF2793 domain-containing protein [Pseudomonadota bacterium]